MWEPSSVGGVKRPGYSHTSQFVSELLETGALNKSLLNPLFALYNLLTIAFGIGLFMRVRSMRQRKGTVSGSLGALILVAEGLFGFLTVFFPQDPRGAPITSIGIIHIALAGRSSLTTILCMVLMGFWFRTIPRLRGYSIYSFIFLQWPFVKAWKLYTAHAPEATTAVELAQSGWDGKQQA